MQTKGTRMSQVTIAYFASMFLTPAIGAAVLGLFYGIRKLKEAIWA
jgi:hypothetical protein